MSRNASLEKLHTRSRGKGKTTRNCVVVDDISNSDTDGDGWKCWRLSALTSILVMRCEYSERGGVQTLSKMEAKWWRGRTESCSKMVNQP